MVQKIEIEKEDETKIVDNVPKIDQRLINFQSQTEHVYRTFIVKKLAIRFLRPFKN